MKYLQTYPVKTVKENFAALRERQQKKQKTCTKNVEKTFVLLLFIAFFIGFFFV